MPARSIPRSLMFCPCVCATVRGQEDEVVGLSATSCNLARQLNRDGVFDDRQERHLPDTAP
jgi:hypothetical protein